MRKSGETTPVKFRSTVFLILGEERFKIKFINIYRHKEFEVDGQIVDTVFSGVISVNAELLLSEAQDLIAIHESNKYRLKNCKIEKIANEDRSDCKITVQYAIIENG